MTQRRTTLLIVAAVGVSAAVLAAIAFWVILPPQLGGGPIKAGNAYGQAFPVKVGQKVTDGFNVVEIGGKRDAVIDSIRPVYVGTSVKTLGSITSDPNRTLGIPLSFYKIWPPSDRKLGVTRPAAGTTIRPFTKGMNYTQILIGMEVTEPGHFLRKGFWLYYHVGSEHFRRFIHSEVTFCTPEAMRGTVCPFLGQGADK